jgi:hypothetical protein
MENPIGTIKPCFLSGTGSRIGLPRKKGAEVLRDPCLRICFNQCFYFAGKLSR